MIMVTMEPIDEASGETVTPEALPAQRRPWPADAELAQ